MLRLLTDRFTIAHAVDGDASQPKLQQHGDLIAPCEGEIRKAVDEDDGASWIAVRDGIKVV